MFALVLAGALAGQLTANDGPPRQWLPGLVNGQTVQVWGWPLNGGRSVGYRPDENPHLSSVPQRQVPQTISPGLQVASNGDLNAGLDLTAAKPTGGLDTNDPDLGEKLAEGERCPRPDPTPDPDDPDPFRIPLPDPLEEYRDILIGLCAGLFIGFLAWLLWPSEKEGYPS